MQILLGVLIGLVLGVAVAVVLARLVFVGRTAARTEADVLRERVVDLEAAVADDAQTAAALAPLRDALGRVEQQVGVLERDRTSQFAALETTIAAVRESTTALGRRPSRSPGRSTPPPSGAPGARCSCAACSSTPGCWPGATSTSR